MAGASVGTNQRLTIGVITTCLLLSVLSFGLRISVRLRSAAKLWYDDYWMVLVMVLCFAMTASEIAGLAFGSGKHEDTLSAENFVGFMKNLYVYMILWAFSVFGVKVGILLFYWRVFPKREFRKAVVVVGGLSVAILGCNFFAFTLQCLPVAKFWNDTVPGTCIDQNAFYTASAVINVCGDIAVLFLPLPVVWNLHASRNKKWSLSLLFLLGAFVCVASIFRIVAVREIDYNDFTYSNVAGGLWSAVEVETGFICANLPSIRPLINRLLFCRHSESTGGGSGRRHARGCGGTGGTSGYGRHIRIRSSGTGGTSGCRTERTTRNNSLEVLAEGSSSEGITLAKARRSGSAASDTGSSKSSLTSDSRGDRSRPGSGGIHVKTEVAMTVDDWKRSDGGNQRNVAVFASPV